LSQGFAQATRANQSHKGLNKPQGLVIATWASPQQQQPPKIANYVTMLQQKAILFKPSLKQISHQARSHQCWALGPLPTDPSQEVHFSTY